MTQDDSEGPWPPPGTPIPTGVQVSWINKNGKTISGIVVDRWVRPDVVMVRSKHVLGTGKCAVCQPGCNGEGCVGYDVHGDPNNKPQAEVTIDFWPGGLFALTNPPPKPEKWKGVPADKCRQTVLLSGLSLLPNQQDLFQVDGS